MDLGLKGLKALVTGASSGLGLVTALELAREGAAVAINSRSGERLSAAQQTFEAEGAGDVVPLVGDVSQADTATTLVADTAEALGGLDLLVTNSGGPPAGAFDALSEADWQAALDLNFNSHRWLIQAALPHLRKSKAASVLTITSISVKQPIENLMLSNTVRAATLALTKSLSQELGPEGIRFNSILPGWTETDRVQQLLETRARDKQTSVVAEIEKQAAATPLARMGQPEEFARVAVFLLSPAASYLSGVMLPVDGGATRGLL